MNLEVKVENKEPFLYAYTFVYENVFAID